MSSSPPNPNPSPMHSAPAAPRRRPWRRIALKSAIFFVVTHFVLFPYPRQFARHLARLQNLDVLIEPEAARLAPLERDVRQLRRAAATQPAEEKTSTAAADQRAVEEVVLEKVHYAWDWDTWGSADYVPTVQEMFDRADQRGGRLEEDCDGRAVIAASLMRRLGYDARLVTDLRHVWVATPDGEWMGPGREKTMTSTPEGTRIQWRAMLPNIAISLSFGIAVFPFWRELVILLTAYALMLHPRADRRYAWVALLLLLQGLLFMRLGFFSPGRLMGGNVSSWPAWIGLLHFSAGFALLMVSARAARRRIAASSTTD